MSSSSPIQQRVAAYSKWARVEDRTTATAVARAAALTALDARLCERFSIDLESPGGPRRLNAARRAHFAELALKSAQSRRRKAVRS